MFGAGYAHVHFLPAKKRLDVELCCWQSIRMGTMTAKRWPDGRALLAKCVAETTQVEFAHRVDCSDSHLCLILKGERGMSFALAKRISAATGIPLESLPHEPA
jgi:hypothetical protein